MNQLVSIALAAAAVLPAGFSPREKAAARTITAAAIAGHVRFLADDLLEGRAPATRGSELAMRYVATSFERLGLSPVGDERSWLQRFEIVGMKAEVTLPMTFAAGAKSLALKPLVESVIASGQQKESAAVKDAEVVFVGYGITAPEQQWDDYKTDVRGKVVLLMNNDPETDPNLFAGMTRLYYGRWDYKYAEAARHGAAGVIIIHTEHSAGYPWQVVQSSWSGQAWELPAGSEPRLDLKMWATEDASRQIARLGGQDLEALRRAAESRDFKPVALGVKLSAGLTVKIERAKTANVLGLLVGSDPKLKDEVIVVSAHHDHLGMHEGGEGDRIFNGALDNASGVAAMLEVARALAVAEPRPKRSILFAAVGAEESGLLGSQYFCEHPIVPPGRLAAVLNIDGVNIWGRTSDIGFIGLGKSSVDELVVAVAKAQGRTVTPDDQPDRGAFYRSDQFNFARIGVPAMYLKAGVRHAGHDDKWGRALHDKFVKERYHQPSDQIDESWNLDGAVEDLQLMTVTLLRLGDARGMPEWKRGDEFEAARKKALAQ